MSRQTGSAGGRIDRHSPRWQKEILIGITCLLAAVASGCGEQPVSWQDAGSYAGERGVVEGPVVNTHYAEDIKGKPTFLDLGKGYPETGVKVIVWEENRNRFPDPPEQMYAGKTIRVSGLIESHEGTPQIEVRSPEQITILD